MFFHQGCLLRSKTYLKKLSLMINFNATYLIANTKINLSVQLPLYDQGVKLERFAVLKSFVLVLEKLVDYIINIVRHEKLIYHMLKNQW